MNLFIYIMDVFQSSTFQDGTEKATPTFDGVNGGGIMHRAERPDGPFAGVQKCPNHGPLSVATRGRGMYGVELYAAVRLAVVDEGLSHDDPSRRFGIDRRTVKKMLSYSAPPDEAGPAAQAGRVHRHRRRDPGGGHGSGRAAQAASHGAPDLRAASRRARVHRRLYHREGLCPGSAASDARGFCAAASPAGPCPGRLRRGGGGGRRAGGRKLPSSA